MRLILAIFLPFLVVFYHWPAPRRHHLPAAANHRAGLDTGGYLGSLRLEPVQDRSENPESAGTLKALIKPISIKQDKTSCSSWHSVNARLP